MTGIDAADETPSEPVADASSSPMNDLTDSGLVMVETRHDKLQAWQQGHPEAPTAPVTPRPRRRRPKVEISDEPLVMVETHTSPTPQHSESIQ